MLNKYLLCLYKQYCSAKGIECKIENFHKLSYEFTEWIAQNKLLSKEYLDYLIYLDVLSSKRVIEVDKGRYDSIAEGKFEVVSRHASSLGLEDKELLLIGGVAVIETSKEIIVPDTDILLTHNPYFSESLTNWWRIHNDGQFDISIGMYGSIYDEDFNEKIKLIEQLSSRMSDDHRIDYDTDKDRYFCTLNSARNKKVKELILSR